MSIPTGTREKTVEETASSIGFGLGIAIAVFGYLAGLTYAYVALGGFGLVPAILISVVSGILSFTVVGMVIWGAVVATLSGGELSWIAAAAGPVLGLGVWAVIGVALAHILRAIFGGLARLFRRRR